MTTLELSPLNKTWIIDLDGTVVKHNGYKIDGYDTLLDGVKEFFRNLKKDDIVIFLTSRKGIFLDNLKKFLADNDIRYNYILSDIPVGERILINDIKPMGLNCAFSINKKRDEKLDIKYKIRDDL